MSVLDENHVFYDLNSVIIIIYQFTCKFLINCLEININFQLTFSYCYFYCQFYVFLVLVLCCRSGTIVENYSFVANTGTFTEMLINVHSPSSNKY